MAKLIGDWSPKTRRAFRGASYIYHRNGQAILAAMPTKHKKTKSQKQLAAMDLMRRRSLAIKAMAPEFVLASSFYARDNALMPRDYLFMCLAGRFTGALMPPEYISGVYANDGIAGAIDTAPPLFGEPLPPAYDKLERIYSVAALDDLSTLFDIYGAYTGNLIVRTPAGWRGLAPGPQGSVLKLGPNNVLEWGAAEGGGGGLSVASTLNGSLNSDNYGTKGNVLNSPIAVTYRGAMVDCEWIAGRTYVASALSTDLSTITSVLTQSDPWVPATSYLGPRYFEFPLPYTAAPNEPVAIAISHPSEPSGTRIRCIQAAAPILGFPLGEPAIAFYLAESDPAPGNTFVDRGTGTMMRVPPGWSA